MARLAIEVKDQRKKDKMLKARANGIKAKYSTRVHNRCRLCGKTGGYIRKFDICRICFRENAQQGKIMGIKKSSW